MYYLFIYIIYLFIYLIIIYLFIIYLFIYHSFIHSFIYLFRVGFSRGMSGSVYEYRELRVWFYHRHIITES